MTIIKDDKGINIKIPRRKKKETSKVVVGIAVALIIILNIFVFGMIIWTKDTSALAYLIPSDLVEAGAATAFYYNKAKKENVIKLLRSQETLDAIKKLQDAGVDPAQFFSMFHE